MRRRFLSMLVMAALLTFGGAEAQQRPTVKMGVEGAYPPFSMITSDGRIEGFDIDIAHALCDAMQVTCELVQQDWDMVPALLDRRYDAIVASMSITRERQKRMDFTKKYYHTPARFVARKSADLTVDEAGLAGKRVGVQRTTIHDSFLTSAYGDGVVITRYRTQAEATAALSEGEIDLVLGDSRALEEGFLQDPKGEDYAFVGPSFTDPRWFGQGVGIALRKGEPELKAQLNAAIDRIRADGTYDKIARKYFTFDVYGS